MSVSIKNLKQFSNAVSKRDTGKVINGVVDTIRNNIKWYYHDIRVARQGIRAKNTRKWHIAQKFDQKQWLLDHVGRSNAMLNQYLAETVKIAKGHIKELSVFKPSDYVFNFGAWYNKPLTTKGTKRMAYRLNHTNDFVDPGNNGTVKFSGRALLEKQDKKRQAERTIKTIDQQMNNETEYLK